jgi:predicted restriction endonuclease
VPFDHGKKNLSSGIHKCNPFVDETPADLKNLPPQTRTVTKTITVNERVNDQDYFRNGIALKLYSACVITGFDVVEVCEAVHIIPVKPYHGPDKPGNCLLMVVSMHRAFDRFFFTILRSGIIVVAPNWRNSSLGVYHGKKLLVPLRDDHREYLAWHNDKFCEQFQKED